MPEALLEPEGLCVMVPEGVVEVVPVGEAEGEAPKDAVVDAVGEAVGVGVGEGSLQAMARRRLFPESENTKRLRRKSNTMPKGDNISALAAGPPSPPKPEVPVPAMVITAPVAVLTRRMRWPAKSDTASSSPELAAATATGSLCVAAVPIPSAPPGVPLPDKVPTAPEEVFTVRILLQKRSARYSTCPLVLRAREKAWLKVALEPTPASAHPAVPFPANALTVG